MNNIIINQNPYGQLRVEDLLSFEQELGVKLPNDYRDYLIEYNGGEFEKDVFEIIGDEGNRTSIHIMYAMAEEPEWASLQKVNEYFDGVDLKKEKFVSIASDPLGNQILLKLNKPNIGSIYFWDHEVPFREIKKILLKQASSFTEFINKLEKVETQEEFLKRLKKENPEQYQVIIEALKERGAK